MEKGPRAAEWTGPRRAAARWMEPAAAVLAWALLLWLAGRPACVEGSSCASSFGGRWGSVAAVLAVVWLAPGWMLWRMLGLRGVPGLSAAAFACGSGLTWLVLLGASVLAVGRQLGHFVQVVTAGNALVTVLFVAWCARRRVEEGGEAGDAATERARGGAWRLALAAVAFLALLGVALGSTGFTYGSDEWFYLRATRQFLDGLGWIYDFEAWEFLLALVVRLARVGLLDAYRVLLPPFLIAFAVLAYLALAQAVLRERRAVAFAFVLEALYCLSDMHTRGTGAGMALLARVVEDKYVALLVPVPLAQAALLRFMAGGNRRWLVAFAPLMLAGELVHPLAAVWVAASMGVLALAWAWGRRGRARWWHPVLAGALAVAVVGAGAWLRSIRNPAYYQLQAPGSAFHAELLKTLRRQLVVLSLDEGWYMGDARLLGHPLVVGAVIAALWLAPRARGSWPRSFLVSATAVPLLLVFTPFTAVWVGSWIGPWIVPRLLWVMPVTLAVAAVLEDRLAALEGKLAGRRARAPSDAAWLVALAVAAALLSPRIVRSVQALHQRNRIHVSPGERELMEFLSSRPGLFGNVLAPAGVSVRLPAWTSRVRPLPGPDSLRGGLPADTAEECARLLAARSVGEEEVARLQRLQIGYVIARNGSSLGRKLARLGPAFTPLFTGTVFSVYAWRPDLWTDAVAARLGHGRR